MYGHVSSLEGTVCILVLKQPNLGGAFKYVLCSPLFWGRWSNLTCAYFSDGLLQPPTNSSKLSGGFWDLGPRCWNRWFTPKNQAFKKKRFLLGSPWFMPTTVVCCWKYWHTLLSANILCQNHLYFARMEISMIYWNINSKPRWQSTWEWSIIQLLTLPGSDNFLGAIISITCMSEIEKNWEDVF